MGGAAKLAASKLIDVLNFAMGLGDCIKSLDLVQIRSFVSLNFPRGVDSSDSLVSLV